MADSQTHLQSAAGNFLKKKIYQLFTLIQP